MVNYIKNFLKIIIGKNNLRKLKEIKVKIKMSKNTELYSNVKNTIRFKKKYDGKRCFILGNGPSLASVDLSKLSSEYVFTVNKISKLDGFETLNSNFHIWVDGAFFNLRKDLKLSSEFLYEQYERTSTVNPICFVPIEAYSYFKKTKLDSKLNLNYFYTNGGLLDYELQSIDMNKGLYGGANVILYALQIAIYMGFNDIYLLGCDETNILGVLNVALGNSGYKLHVYENDDSNKDYEKILKTWKISDVLLDSYYVFRQFEKLSLYCKNNNVNLINCSENTLIDSIDRKKLDDIL